MESSDHIAPANDPGPPYVGALLRLSWQRVRAQLNAAIRAAGFDDLQDTHMLVFSYPAPDGVRPSDLARRLTMSRQATNHVIAQLEALGYLERRAAEGEERRRVYLTARGHAVGAVIFAHLRKVQADWAQEIGPERFAAFMAVLRQMADLPGPGAAP